MNSRSPREVNLGFGGWVRIERVPKGHVQAHMSDETCVAFWSSTHDSKDKYWGRIFLDKELSKKEGREKHFHELTHAGIDLWDCAIRDLMPRLDLPSSIHLGYGIWWKIEEVNKGQMKASAGQDEDAFSAETHDSADKYAGRIFINKDLPKREKRLLFFRELNHALVDAYLEAAESLR